MSLTSRRWSTRFGRFAYRLGAPRLAAAIGVRQFTVYNWIAGRHDPKPEHARAIVALSGGSLDFNAIYRHRQELETEG